jgi:Ca2+-binding RTX toxin-like protein
MLRRAAMLAVVGSVLLVAFAGVALAAVITCTGGFCDGTNYSDQITGTEGYDHIEADSGDDDVFAQGGDDEVWGGRGDDAIYGDYLPSGIVGSDTIKGERGDDVMVGYGRSDKYYGGPDDDEIDAREYGDLPGTDIIRGERGRDEIYTVDGAKDIIDCGDHRDLVTFDRNIDSVANCERQRPLPSVVGVLLETIQR